MGRLCLSDQGQHLDAHESQQTMSIEAKHFGSYRWQEAAGSHLWCHNFHGECWCACPPVVWWSWSTGCVWSNTTLDRYLGVLLCHHDPVPGLAWCLRSTLAIHWTEYCVDSSPYSKSHVSSLGQILVPMESTCRDHNRRKMTPYHSLIFLKYLVYCIKI